MLSHRDIITKNALEDLNQMAEYEFYPYQNQTSHNHETQNLNIFLIHNHIFHLMM
jgi:hypothetical protein